MALINPIHGDMSGSVGDNVFSHNKGGRYVRTRAIPINPTSTKQTAARASLGSIAASWNTLTDLQRTAWKDWAALNPVVNRLGLPQIVSGINAFIQCNARLQQQGFAFNADPPVNPGPAQFDTPSATPTAPDSIDVDVASGTLGTGEQLLLWMTLPALPGRDPNFNQARLVGYSAVAATFPITFTTPYPFAAGNEFNAYVQRMSADGLVSPVQKIRVPVP